jgi:hypothetical protein
MSKVGQPFTCGIWTVRDGSEEEFVTRWTALVSSGTARCRVFHPDPGSAGPSQVHLVRCVGRLDERGRMASLRGLPTERFHAESRSEHSVRAAD